MKAKRIVKLASLLIGAVGISSLYFNCAGNNFSTLSSNAPSVGSQNLPETQLPPAPQPEPVVDPNDLSGILAKGQSEHLLLTANQVFNTMINLTGQNAIAKADQLAEFRIRAGLLPDNSKLDGYNAPLQLSAMSLAGVVCNGRLTTPGWSLTQRVNFNDSLAKNGNPALNQTIVNFANEFWGRDPSSEELTLLNEYYQEFLSGLTAQEATNKEVQTNKFYLSLCTAMLASVDSLVN